MPGKKRRAGQDALGEALLVHEGAGPSEALRRAREALDGLSEAELVVLAVLLRERLARFATER